MNFFILFITLLVALTNIYAAEIEIEDGVLVLDEENFDQALQDNSLILVEVIIINL